MGGRVSVKGGYIRNGIITCANLQAFHLRLKDKLIITPNRFIECLDQAVINIKVSDIIHLIFEDDAFECCIEVFVETDWAFISD